MGFFSWLTSDTEESITNTFSNRGAKTVYLYTPNGKVIEETDYEGYGEFGGKDAYVLLAEWNLPESELVGLTFDEKRSKGIRLFFRESPPLKYPLKFSFSPDWSYDELEGAKDCPEQGFFYDDDEDDDLW